MDLPAAALYLPDGDAIAIATAHHYDNRPLYGDHRACALLAGDRPQFRLLRAPWPCGTLTIALRRANGTAAWLHDWSGISARYRAGVMRWTLSDARFPALQLELEAAALAAGEGFTVRLAAHGARAGDAVVWAYGGATDFADGNLFWHADPGMHPSVSAQALSGESISGALSRLRTGFLPEDCRRNAPGCDAAGFRLAPPQANGAYALWGRCSAGSWQLADASTWHDPLALLASAPAELPLIAGSAPLDRELFWSVRGGSAPATAPLPDPAADLAAARQRADRLAAVVQVSSPDAWLDAAMPALATAMDACWYAPVFVHGGMSWNVPFPGWRTLYGPTALGWIERVRAQARHYIASQVTSGGPSGFARDDQRGCLPGANSAFYGLGRIATDQHFYNFQSVFFDMLVHAWRWTADPELERLLRPALDLHLRWMATCFDPDGDGLYESVLDTWASDSIWYNGAGTAQASAYAFTGHRAAADLARRAGDSDAERHHAAMAERIRGAVADALWSRERGHLGSYREALGLRRRNDNADIYGVCLPIDAGLVSDDQALSHARYGEWGLQRVPMALGGSQVVTSNFVPYTWSVREIDSADTCHLALAAYQVGRSDDGWELLSGCLRESLYRSPVPGGIICQPVSEPNPHTDFADAVSMMARTIIEGLFGLRPDRPAGVVRVRPQLPPAWDRATLSTADIRLRFARGEGSDTWSIALAAPLAVELRIPVPGRELLAVETSGTWRHQSGLGGPEIIVALPAGSAASVVVRWRDRRALAPLRRIAIAPGQPLRLDGDGAAIIAWSDAQGALADARLHDGVLVASVNPSDLAERTVLLDLAAHGLRWRQAVALVGRSPAMPRALPAAAARFRCCDASAVTSDDLRTIFTQDYRAPRPHGASASLGYDGWSPWTYPFWKRQPPAIDFSAADALRDADGRLLLPPGVPFAWHGGARNAACTSRWERWPRQATLPLNGRGRRLWLLLAAATNHMQIGLANAAVTVRYDDGSTTLRELSPPGDLWSIDGRYRTEHDAFALPAQPPHQAMLGNACRVCVVPIELVAKAELSSVTLETLSLEVITALMAVTVEE